jgi:hypothetical protein
MGWALVEVAGGELVAGEEVGEVGEAFGEDVDDLALALDVAVALEEAGVSGGGVVFFEGVWPDDEVDDAGLVFEGFEDDAAGGAGALADEDQAGDFDPGVVGGLVDLVGGGDAEFFEVGADQGDGVFF